MTGAILYQPGQKWRIGAAFGVAALIHLAAIALATAHPNNRVKELPPEVDGFSSSDPTEEVSLDNPTPPPVPPEPPDPLPSSDTDELFPVERPTPPPISRPSTRLAAPIVRPSGRAIFGSHSLSIARVNALNAPKPEYPYEARRQRVTGSGIVVMTVDLASGQVTKVIMEESTGSLVLDNAAITGFQRWRFKPGTVSKVRSPVTFTMAGAQF
jgi:periplasmic protein TonB